MGEDTLLPPLRRQPLHSLYTATAHNPHLNGSIPPRYTRRKRFANPISARHRIMRILPPFSPPIPPTSPI